MAIQALPMKPRREMQEVKAPEQFTFTKAGQTLNGILVSIEPVTVREKQVMEYLFQTDGGGRLTCLGTADLDKKINPQHVGHYMEIRYERDDSSFQKEGQSPMKVFKVHVSKEREAGF